MTTVVLLANWAAVRHRRVAVGLPETNPRPGGYYDEEIGRQWRPWTIAHLEGRHPSGHPKAPTYSRSGEVQIRKDQVWVGKADDRLYVIRRIQKRIDAEPVVHVSLYRQTDIIHSFTESTLRQGYRIWDEAERDRQTLFNRLLTLSLAARRENDVSALHQIQVAADLLGIRLTPRQPR